MVEDVFRLSPMQQLMLVHEVSQPSSLVLTNQFRFEIQGVLDETAFHAAWRDLVARHPALRTAFLWEGLPHPVQVVREQVVLPFDRVDLRCYPDHEQCGRVHDLQRAARHPIDIGNAPLMRLTLLRVRDDRWTLLWSCHHLVVDRWCLGLLFRDLAEIYVARLESRPPRLPTPGSFRDYISWVAAQSATDAESFWRATLRGFRAPTLVSDTPAVTPADSPASGSMTRDLSASTSRGLKELARTSRVGLGSVLLGGIGLSIAHITRRADVVVGLTVTGRPSELPDSVDTVGCFINNIPVRLRIGAGERLGDWIGALQRAQARRQRHEWVAADQIWAWCDLLPGVPLFDVLALLNPTPPETVTWPEGSMVPLTATLAAAQPLIITVADVEGALRLTAVYDEVRVGEPRVRAILDVLRRLLSDMADGADAPLSTLVPRLVAEPAISVVPAAVGTDTAEASGSTAEVLQSIWREILGVDVGLDNELFALGMTSLQAAQGFVEIERRLGRALPLSTLFSAGSVRSLLDVLRGDDESPLPIPSLVEIQPRGSHPQLFVIPGECGDLLGMAGLVRVLGPRQPVYGLQSRGLDGREAPRTRVEDIGADFAAAIVPVARDPFVLLGLAGGAAVALETQRRLAATGHPAALLVVMNPMLPAGRLSGIRRAASFVRERLSFHWNDLRRADTPQRAMRLVLEKAGRFARFDRAGSTVNGRPLSAAAHVQRANRTAFLRHRSRPYHGPVSVLYTSEGRMARGATARRAWWLGADASKIRLVAGVNPFPESVLDIGADPLTSGNLAVVATELRQQIDGVNGSRSVDAASFEDR